MLSADWYALAADAAAALRARTGVERHDAVVVLGSGWDGAAEALSEWDPAPIEFPATELPGFLPALAPGHQGLIRSVRFGSGASGERRLLIFLGRTHLYEGHGPGPVAHGIRTAAAAGCRLAVITSANGSLRADWQPGTGVVLSDHLNLSGASPLTGPRFVDLTHAWTPSWRERALAVDPTLVSGIYAMLRGPHYESWAEAHALSRLGADVVGMSTVLEVIAAREAGLETLGISVVTAVEASSVPVDSDSVLKEAAAAATRLGKVIATVLDRAA